MKEETCNMVSGFVQAKKMIVERIRQRAKWPVDLFPPLWRESSQSQRRMEKGRDITETSDSCIIFYEEYIIYNKIIIEAIRIDNSSEYNNR